MTTSFGGMHMESFDNNIYSNKKSDNFDNFKKSQFKTDRLAQAELEMYYDSVNTINPGHFDSESMNECSKELSNYYKPSEPFDNTAYLTDLIVDDRIKKNHEEWVSEVTPWAGTASVIGATEFSAGDYLNFQGLRRPRGVQQVDPWQVTEVDEEQLMDNKPFIL